PQDADSYAPQALAHTVCHTPQEKAHFARLLALGMTDAFRLFPQPAGSYTWWDYRQASFRRNQGLRIDHILASRALAPQVRACTIDRTPRTWERPSDHAPMLVELA
ncbi:MAG: exodeoxyribonuclease III, partial [Ottowia sp.]|nr:exodeoxyribonuclease III [Ottowia sp.]